MIRQYVCTYPLEGIEEASSQRPNLALEVSEGGVITYSIPEDKGGAITAFDPSGRRVATFNVSRSGQTKMPSDLPSAVYFIRLESGSESITRKSVILR